MKKIVTLTGPSCAGKGYLMGEVRDFMGADELRFYTTRQPRNGERGPRIFVKEEEFDTLIGSGRLWLYTAAFGSRYGAGIEETDRLLSIPTPMVAEIHADNVALFKQKAPSANMIALLPRTMHVLKKRMALRHDCHAEARLASAEVEMAKIRELGGCFNLTYYFDGTDEKHVISDIKKYLEVYYALFDRVRRANCLG